MNAALKDKLEAAARFIIETSARETSSGNHIMCAEDIPASILSRAFFEKHIEDIARVMREYESVAEVEVTPEGEIDTIMFLDYCPNFVPDADERDNYPDDREIKDPINPKNTAELMSRNTHELEKSTLADKLKQAKQKALEQPGIVKDHPKKRGFEHDH